MSTDFWLGLVTLPALLACAGIGWVIAFEVTIADPKSHCRVCKMRYGRAPRLWHEPIVPTRGKGWLSPASWWHFARHPRCLARTLRRRGRRERLRAARVLLFIPSWMPACTKDHPRHASPTCPTGSAPNCTSPKEAA